MENKKSEKNPEYYITDHQAEQILKMAKDFYAKPENVEAYRQWHFKEFGCWPEDAKK